MNKNLHLKKNKKIEESQDTNLKFQEEKIKSLIINIESQNTVLDKLTLDIETILKEKLNQTKTK